MTSDLIQLDPRTPRCLGNAVRAAMRPGTSSCGIRLTDGSTHYFTIAEVLDDGLMGERQGANGKACLVHFHAIAMIEFG